MQSKARSEGASLPSSGLVTGRVEVHKWRSGLVTRVVVVVVVVVVLMLIGSSS
jgi:hypothetical protein